MVDARTKASTAIELGLADKALTDGADEELQLLNVCAKIAKSMELYA